MKIITVRHGHSTYNNDPSLFAIKCDQLNTVTPEGINWLRQETLPKLVTAIGKSKYEILSSTAARAVGTTRLLAHDLSYSNLPAKYVYFSKSLLEFEGASPEFKGVLEAYEVPKYSDWLKDPYITGVKSEEYRYLSFQQTCIQALDFLHDLDFSPETTLHSDTSMVVVSHHQKLNAIHWFLKDYHVAKEFALDRSKSMRTRDALEVMNREIRNGQVTVFENC